LEDIKPEAWHKIFAANVDATLYLSQALVPAMKQSGWGRIVTISSGAGLRPSLTGIHAYTAAKHALVGLTKQLSLELAPHGITVNSIAPGFVLSNPATKRQWAAYGAEGQAQLVSRIHTRRLGQPEDIAAATVFLTSEEASWITAQILSVDGGIT
jgi:3-oxoacyl-[acyl-carrier protein] reductase